MLMNKRLLYWKLLIGLTILVSSCNIKAPIDQILPEGNRNGAPVVSLNIRTDTLNIKSFLPEVMGFDSVTSNSLRIKHIKKKSPQFTYSISDPNKHFHEITIWKNNMKSTLIAIQESLLSAKDSIGPRMKIKSFLNNVLFISGVVHPKEMVILWQNTILPRRFIKTDTKGISITIPKEAKEVKESTLRVFATDQHGMIGILRIPLYSGQPL